MEFLNSGDLNMKRFIKRMFFSKVSGGPFVKMKYALNAYCGSFFPKALGTYEKEIWPYISQVISWTEGTFVDVGAAEGYYAVGIPFLNKNIKSVAFEINEDARNAILNLAEKNKIVNIQVNEKADFNSLNKVLNENPKSFMLVDIEGGEFELINPDLIPRLRSIPFLVEIHDWVLPKGGPTALQIFSNRFDSTHEISAIYPAERNVSEINNFVLRLFCILSKTIEDRLLKERTVKTPWFFFKPKSS